MTTITNLELIGGHPLIDFINTELITQGERADLLNSTEDYLTWLYHAGLITEKPAAAHPPIDLLPLIRYTRQQLRYLLEAIYNNQPFPPKPVTTINKLLQQRSGRPELTHTNGRFTHTFTYHFTTAEQYLAPIADTAVDFLTTADFQRLKKCGNDECIRYFLDTSRNRSRRWCSMDGCGNRMKARAFYERHRKE